MKVRLTSRGLRARLDDLELAALNRGEPLEVAAAWPGGGWRLVLDPATAQTAGTAGDLRVGVREVLAGLNDPAREGVRVEGPPRVDIEKEFGPQHG
ncbi:hypothetical protein [Deinococcus gobiensis]|uniref:Uncharacterized protein n=1 Tax=Deinococcus gobiensis (strain DSM 21396 / JCM 16679 / CGMCC 1.7299 / I-0) TaxID=745776 RepID=H8GWI3_DEIGI|nr:hypothetical protein [Deinococcus gobiensis]AFD26886.1 hypothetical protein DGo_CA2959 [Deinococcus gobiensis I-0]